MGGSVQGQIQQVLWDGDDREMKRQRYLSGFDLVSRGAAPAFQIGENFAFLSVKARMHLTPPLLLHYGGWRREREVRSVSTPSYHLWNTAQHS